MVSTQEQEVTEMLRKQSKATEPEAAIVSTAMPTEIPEEIDILCELISMATQKRPIDPLEILSKIKRLIDVLADEAMASREAAKQRLHHYVMLQQDLVQKTRPAN